MCSSGTTEESREIIPVLHFLTTSLRPQHRPPERVRIRRLSTAHTSAHPPPHRQRAVDWGKALQYRDENNVHTLVLLIGGQSCSEAKAWA